MLEFMRGCWSARVRSSENMQNNYYNSQTRLIIDCHNQYCMDILNLLKEYNYKIETLSALNYV